MTTPTTTNLNNTMNTTTTNTMNINKKQRRRKKGKKKHKKKQKQSEWASLDVTIGLQDDNKIPESSSHTHNTHYTHTSKQPQHLIPHQKLQQMNNNWRPNKPKLTTSHNTHNHPSQPQLKEYIGTLKCYKSDRDFGFIQCNNLKNDIFFHTTAFTYPQQISNYSNIIGNSVKFNISTYNDKYSGELKQKAINISIIQTNSAAIILNNTASKPPINNWHTDTKSTPTNTSASSININTNWRTNNTATIQPYSAIIASKSKTNCRQQPCKSPSPCISTISSISATTISIPESSQYKQGTLLFYCVVRNFGFISCDSDHDNDMNMNDNNNKNHLFVHGSEFKCNKSDIYKGMRVEFMIKYYNNGQRKAINVNIEIEINDNESIISNVSSIPSCV
eukprot:706479_1